MRPRRDRAALSPNDLLPINIDVQLAALTALRAVPTLHALRVSAVGKLRDIALTQYDAIEPYAKALAYAQTAFLAASTPANALPALAARAIEIRAQLVSDATALARRKLLDARRLAHLKRGTGYLSIASDLGVLVRLLRERWSEIAGNSAIQARELDEAEQLFERLTTAYAERGSKSALLDAAADDRRRAFALLVNAYDGKEGGRGADGRSCARDGDEQPHGCTRLRGAALVVGAHRRKAPEDVLTLLVASTPGDEGKWFAAAKSARPWAASMRATVHRRPSGP